MTEAVGAHPPPPVSWVSNVALQAALPVSARYVPMKVGSLCSCNCCLCGNERLPACKGMNQQNEKVCV